MWGLYLVGLASLLSLVPGEPCAVIAVDRGPTYRLAATVDTDGSAAGTYALDVTKVGPAGRSTTRQSGAFDVEDRGSHVLSSLNLSVAEGDRLDVSLRVVWSDGRTSTDALIETVRLAD